jgi:hypothetical protein
VSADTRSSWISPGVDVNMSPLPAISYLSRMLLARWDRTLPQVTVCSSLQVNESCLYISTLLWQLPARENIIQICDTIIASENLESKDDLRVAVSS